MNNFCNCEIEEESDEEGTTRNINRRNDFKFLDDRKKKIIAEMDGLYIVYMLTGFGRIEHFHLEDEYIEHLKTSPSKWGHFFYSSPVLFGFMMYGVYTPKLLFSQLMFSCKDKWKLTDICFPKNFIDCFHQFDGSTINNMITSKVGGNIITMAGFQFFLDQKRFFRKELMSLQFRPSDENERVLKIPLIVWSTKPDESYKRAIYKTKYQFEFDLFFILFCIQKILDVSGEYSTLLTTDNLKLKRHKSLDFFFEIMSLDKFKWEF